MFRLLEPPLGSVPSQVGKPHQTIQNGALAFRWPILNRSFVLVRTVNRERESTL
jgi:hypothetical protein